MTDLSATIDAAWEARGELSFATTREVRDAVEVRLARQRQRDLVSHRAAP